MATLRMWRDALEAGTQPARAAVFAVVIAECALVLAGPKRTESEWASLAKVFARDLRELPEDLLLDAASQYRKGAKFFPTPADLYELAIGPLRDRRSKLNAINEILTYIAPHVEAAA